ncbi:MAG: ATP-dependent DNA helicase RecG [Leptospirales bacterium]
MEKRTLSLISPLSAVPEIGPKRLEKLSRMEIRTVLDLLYYFPFRYEDRRASRTISQFVPGISVGFKARVRSIRKKELRSLRVPLLEAVLEDGSGTVQAVWFGQEYLLKTLPEGSIAFFFGKPEVSDFDGRLSIRSPVIEKIDLERKNQKSFHVNRIVPVYHEEQGLGAAFFRKTIGTILASLWGADFDPIPSSVRSLSGLPDWFPSLVELHFPKDLPEAGNPDSLLDPRLPARRRFVFEELFFLEFLMGHKKREIQSVVRPSPYLLPEDSLSRFESILPFSLTLAQNRVLSEIFQDLSRPVPMNRLLLGDVGSGKTVVAAWGIFLACQSGFQSAFMAPTEILALQHFSSLSSLLDPLGIRIALMTQSVRGVERKKIMESVYNGNVDLVVGTHALIQDALSFRSLRFVVVDEQHKFGVEQRRSLIQKGGNPDVLVMTATPIPRSLALSYFGDLDLSILDERPLRRQPVKTAIVPFCSSEGFWDDCVMPAIKRGEQVFVVYPLIEEGKSDEIRDATSMHGFLSNRWSELRIELLTGRMSSGEKESIMQSFREGRVNLLVATTVIEVGVDVPNATVMVVENAERFGLAQLHQLRGRIGRGEKPGFCYLILGKGASSEALERLEILVRCDDGFLVSEEDLKTRGPGEFLGTRQSGLPTFRVANLVRDEELLLEARKRASAFLEHQAGGHSLHTWEWTTLMNFIRNRFPGVEEWLLVR